MPTSASTEAPSPSTPSCAVAKGADAPAFLSAPALAPSSTQILPRRPRLGTEPEPPAAEAAEAALPEPPSAEAAEAAVAPVAAEAALAAKAADAAVAHYLALVMDAAQGAALTAVHQLAEPRRPVDPTIALRVVGQLAATLAGFAVGAAVLPLAQRLRQAGGPTARLAIERTLQTRLAAGAPPLSPPSPVPEGPRFLADPEHRPLVDQLGRQLCARMPSARRTAQALLRALVDDVSRASADPAARLPPPVTSSILTVALRAAASERTWLTERITRAVTDGWHHAAAVILGAPDLTGPWSDFTRRAAGLPEPTPSPADTDALTSGYLLRIG